MEKKEKNIYMSYDKQKATTVTCGITAGSWNEKKRKVWFIKIKN